MNEQPGSEQAEPPKINHSVVPVLLISGTVISAIAFFGKAAMTTDESERFALAVLMVVSCWSGFVLFVRHRSWVKSLREPSLGP